MKKQEVKNQEEVPLIEEEDPTPGTFNRAADRYKKAIKNAVADEVKGMLGEKMPDPGGFARALNPDVRGPNWPPPEVPIPSSDIAPPVPPNAPPVSVPRGGVCRRHKECKEASDFCGGTSYRLRGIHGGRGTTCMPCVTCIPGLRPGAAYRPVDGTCPGCPGLEGVVSHTQRDSSFEWPIPQPWKKPASMIVPVRNYRGGAEVVLGLLGEGGEMNANSTTIIPKAV